MCNINALNSIVDYSYSKIKRCNGENLDNKISHVIVALVWVLCNGNLLIYSFDLIIEVHRLIEVSFILLFIHSPFIFRFLMIAM